jgi:hypothetical protein
MSIRPQGLPPGMMSLPIVEVLPALLAALGPIQNLTTRFVCDFLVWGIPLENRGA